MRKALYAAILALCLTPTAHAAPSALRILYATDWAGPTQIFAVDPAGRRPLGQVTFGRVPPCPPSPYPVTCGFIDPIPAPDGRHILYRSNIDFARSRLWVANANGTGAHVIVRDLPADRESPPRTPPGRPTRAASATATPRAITSSASTDRALPAARDAGEQSRGRTGDTTKASSRPTAAGPRPRTPTASLSRIAGRVGLGC